MELFEQKKVWDVKGLSEKLGVAEGMVGRDIGWWVEQGVLSAVEGGFRVMEVLEDEGE